MLAGSSPVVYPAQYRVPGSRPTGGGVFAPTPELLDHGSTNSGQRNPRWNVAGFLHMGNDEVHQPLTVKVIEGGAEQFRRIEVSWIWASEICLIDRYAVIRLSIGVLV